MILELTIKNFALIQQAYLVFNKGYTVITGETGSGKSILLNALNLLLGERADYKVIGSASEKAIVEAVFEIEEAKFLSFFSENEIELNLQTIVRREITTQGRSRAFINDVPVSLGVLKTFSEQLISIHSQYNTLELKRKEFQIQTLDILASTTQEQETFSKKYEQYRKIQKEIETISNSLAQQEKEREYNEFQRIELEELQLETRNFQDAQNELNTLEFAKEIHQLKQSISNDLSREQGVLENIHHVNEQIKQLANLDNSFAEIENRVNSTIVELKDIEDEIRQSLEGGEQLDEDELKKQIQAQTNLVDKYNRALVKHKCLNQSELLKVYEQFRDMLSDTDVLTEKLVNLQKNANSLLTEIIQNAEVLHNKRQKAIQGIEQTIKSSLSDLKLPDTELIFQLEKKDELNSYGFSVLSMLFSANKGFAPVEIEKAASGGELSRVMLALQQLISEKMQLPTIFFDEIDTGVSGDVAEKIGVLLRHMGNRMQLFAISHLPQVAAKATHHFKVEKNTINELVQTAIRPLLEEERIEEIARLMSGEKINEAAKINAKALMMN